MFSSGYSVNNSKNTFASVAEYNRSSVQPLHTEGKRAADLTVSTRPGTSYRIEIHFAVFNPLYLLFCFIKLVETW